MISSLSLHYFWMNLLGHDFERNQATIPLIHEENDAITLLVRRVCDDVNSLFADNRDLKRELKNVTTELIEVRKENAILNSKLDLMSEKLDVLLKALNVSSVFDQNSVQVATPSTNFKISFSDSSSSSSSKSAHTHSSHEINNELVFSPTPANTTSVGTAKSITTARIFGGPLKTYVVTSTNIPIDEAVDGLFSHNLRFNFGSQATSQQQSAFNTVYKDYILKWMSKDAKDFCKLDEPEVGALRDQWLRDKIKYVRETVMAINTDILPYVVKVVNNRSIGGLSELDKKRKRSTTYNS